MKTKPYPRAISHWAILVCSALSLTSFAKVTFETFTGPGSIPAKCIIGGLYICLIAIGLGTLSSQIHEH